MTIPNLPHHVTQRGGRRQDVFFIPEDRSQYLSLLNLYFVRYEVELLAYCLMTNHIHLLVVPRTAIGMSRAIQLTHKRYAYYINSRYGWTGHLWQERFYSSAIEYSRSLMVAKYIEQNPVKAGITDHPALYPWSSARHHSGLERSSLIGANPRWESECSRIESWKEWIAKPNDPKAENELRTCTKRDVPFGTEDFILKLEKQLGVSLAPRGRGRPGKK